MQDPFIIKTHNKQGVERNILNLIKGTCNKPTTNVTSKGERLTAFTEDQVLSAFTDHTRPCSRCPSQCNQVK